MTEDRPIRIERRPLRLTPDARRVISRPFLPEQRRIAAVVNRVLSLSEEEVEAELRAVLADFASRHRDIESVFERHLHAAAPHVDRMPAMSRRRGLLLGAYFTSEYSIESVALFNPSIVAHPDQSGLPEGSRRFIVSLRATGEQHISSIAFRSGVIDRDNNITIDEITPYVAQANPIPDARYVKQVFALKLTEMGAYNEIAEAILEMLPEEFTYHELRETCAAVDGNGSPADLITSTIDAIRWLAKSNYHISFNHGRAICEQLIFPVSEIESRGIEDARFVRFVEEDGSTAYHATYTAYNGFRTLPMLLSTRDFHTFKINTLNGRCVRNKGMALFPRRVNGQFVMLGRLDGENIFLMRSDNIHFWDEATELLGPRYPWEFYQIGNCGSPIETDRGWLVLTHGVGCMRRYSIGAFLLDLQDPAKVIGRLKEPLLTPREDERDGYVPNVVYSCGGMDHRDHLLVAYAMSDTASSFATVPLSDIWDRLGA